MVLPPRDRLVTKPVNTLANDLLGREEGAFPMACESVRETLAEKTVAMLRRLSEDRDRIRNDPHLIRHVYDIACIVSARAALEADGELQRLFNEKVAYDGQSFAAHCEVFSRDPESVMRSSLRELAENPIQEEHYAQLVATLVYEESPPGYAAALALFTSLAGRLISGFRQRGPGGPGLPE